MLYEVITETIKQKETATKYFPSDFKEAIDIEEKRQEVLFTGSRADMGNANDQAFAEMSKKLGIKPDIIRGKINWAKKKGLIPMQQPKKRNNFV